MCNNNTHKQTKAHGKKTKRDKTKPLPSPKGI